MIYAYPTFFDCIDGATAKAAEYSVGLKNKILIFTEDKLTLSTELSLAEKTGGSFSAEVSSFGRYIQKHSATSSTLSKEGRAMVVKRLLNSRSEELSAFKSLSSLPSLPEELSELIAQLKSAKVSPKDLSSCVSSCPKNVAAKIADVALVYGDYEKFLSDNGLTDSNTLLSALPEILLKDEALPSTRVIFVGFSSVTKQSCEVVETVFKNAKSCDFFCVAGKNEDLYTCEFYEFVKRLDSSSPVFPPFSAEKEAAKLLERLFDPSSLSKPGEFSDKIFLYEAKSVVDECEFIASRIRYEIMQGGVKYRDIAIAVGDMTAYSLPLKRKLSDYDIPYFSDEKRKLSSHPIFRLYKSLFRSYERGGDLYEIKNAISNSLFIPEKTYSDAFLKAITEKALTSESFLKPETDLGEIYLNAKKNAIAKFCEKLLKKDKAKNYVSALKDFFSSAGVAENAEQTAEKLNGYGEKEEADFLNAGLKKMDEALLEIENILGEEILSSSEFLKILEAGAEASEISILPEFYDSVYLSDLKNCRFKKYDILFAAGLNSSIPAVKSDVALLRDGDIDKLEELSVKVEPKIRAVNEREKEAAGVSLASFKDKLFLSYSTSECAGAKSDILEYAEKAFSDENKRLLPFTRLSFLKARNSDDERIRLEARSYDYSALRPALFALAKDCDDFKNGAADDIDSASAFYLALKKFDGGKNAPLADALLNKLNEDLAIIKNIPSENYFSGGMVSASLLETYYSCPYKNFLKYGVGLWDSLSPEIRALDLGNVLHKVAEEFVLLIEKIASDGDATAAADEIFDKIMQGDGYSKFLQRADYKYSVSLLKKEAEKLCVSLYEEFLSSGFKPIGTEVWFGKGGVFKPLSLNTKKKGYRLHGKADRLDAFTDKEGNVYYRIVDYKTGSVDKKVKDESLYAGLNLQLYLYLKAFTSEGQLPAGAYYYEVADNFSENGEKFIPMRGKTLVKDEILLATQKDFSPETEGRFVNLKYKKLKSGDKLSGEIADGATFAAYMGYAKRMAEEAVNDITDGVIVSSPYQSACDYCEYGAICRHDPSSDDRTRKENGVNSQTIIDAINGTEGNENE